jgi:hypothetical protein
MSDREIRIATALIMGGLAGLAATVPMTMAMTRIHGRLPWHQRYALPPRIITDRISERAPLPASLLPARGPERALAAHFLFGGATGSAYGLLTSTTNIKPTVASGVIYGLGIWTVSYLGWVPAANLMPPATRQPRERNAMMIAAHIVWGAALGLGSAAGLAATRSESN